MKKVLVITMLASTLLACKNNKEQASSNQEEVTATNYAINAEIKGLEDGARVIMVDLDTQTKLDSCLAKEGKLYLEGNTEKPLHAILRIYKAESEGFNSMLGVSRSFYLDNANYTLETDTTNLAKGYFVGGKENDVVNAFEKSLEPYRLKVDSISNEFRNNRDITEEDRDKMLALYDATNKEIGNKEKAFILANPDIYPALHKLNRYVISYENYIKFQANPKLFGGMKPMEPLLNKEELDKAYNNTIEKYKNSDLGKSIYTTLFEEKIAVGEPYIEFVDTYTMDGKPFKVTDVKTDYVLLDFTGVYCGWCKKFNKAILPHYDKVKDKLTIVSFYTDVTDKELIKKSSEKEGLPWMVVSDFKGSNSVNKRHYQIGGIPDFYFLDKTRNVVKRVAGYDEAFIKELSEL